jgi:hypothetical protein
MIVVMCVYVWKAVPDAFHVAGVNAEGDFYVL